MARANISQAGGLRPKSSGPTIVTPAQLQSTCKIVSHERVPLPPIVTVPGAQYYSADRDRSDYGALGPQSKISELMKVRDMPIHYTTMVTTNAPPLVIRSRTQDTSRLFSAQTTTESTAITYASTTTSPTTKLAYDEVSEAEARYLDSVAVDYWARLNKGNPNFDKNITSTVTTSSSTSRTRGFILRDESRNVAAYMEWLQQYGGMGKPRYSTQAISTVPSSIVSSTITIVSSSNFIPSTVKFLSTIQPTILKPVISQVISQTISTTTSINPASRVRKSVDLDESSSDSDSTTKKPSTLLPLLKPVPARCIAPTSVVYSMLPQPGDTADKPIVIEEGDNSSSSSEESYHSVRHVVVSVKAVGTTASGLSTGVIPSSRANIPITISEDYTIRADEEELQEYSTQDVDMNDIVDQPMPEENPDGDQFNDVVYDVPVSNVSSSYMYVDILPVITTAEPVSVPIETSNDDNNNNDISHETNAMLVQHLSSRHSPIIGGPPIIGDLNDMLMRIDDALASARAITDDVPAGEALAAEEAALLAEVMQADVNISVSSADVTMTTSIPMESQPVLHVSTLGMINENSGTSYTTSLN